jgi:hypothetical protein
VPAVAATKRCSERPTKRRAQHTPTQKKGLTPLSRAKHSGERFMLLSEANLLSKRAKA